MTVSIARQPRSLVKVNGQIMAGWLDWEVDNNAHYQADTFRIVFAVSALPSGYGAEWWADQDKLDIEILAGVPADPVSYGVADLTSLLLGQVDDLAWSLHNGRMELTGRDLTARLIDTKTSEKYPNHTASDVATKLALGHGLTPVVTATQTKVGTYYQIDHVALQSERSEWDLLTWLAGVEGFRVYVKGQELHFEPKAASPTVCPITVTRPAAAGAFLTANGSQITIRHAKTLAKDIAVYVRSWNAKSKKGFTAKAEAPRVRNKVTRAAGRPVTPTQAYYYTIAGLSADQAQQQANQILRDLSKHEVRLSLDGPADVSLDIAYAIQLSGTGTAYDQTFYPDSITRSFDPSEGGGFHWTIEAKNHSPESTPPP